MLIFSAASAALVTVLSKVTVTSLSVETGLVALIAKTKVTSVLIAGENVPVSLNLIAGRWIVEILCRNEEPVDPLLPR